MPNSENNSQPRIIHKVALAHFIDKKVMQVRDNKNEQVFIAPGGKVEEAESDIECLKREIREELDVDLDENSISFLHEFTGPAHGHDKKSVLLNIKFYTADIIGEPKPTEEIVEIQYFDSHTDPKHLSEIARTQFFPWFKKHDHIN